MNKKNILTISSIKIIALILMTIDHIALYFPQCPLWFRYIGRISAPLFFFASSEGIIHTHNRKEYLVRLYKMGILMSILNFIFNTLLSTNIESNIFVPLFHVTLIIYIFEEFKNLPKKRNLYLAIYFVWQIISTIIFSFLDNYLYFSFIPTKSIYTAMGNYLMSSDISYYLTAIALVWYFGKNNSRKITIVYGIYCIVYFSLTVVNIQGHLFSFLVNNSIISNNIAEILFLPFTIIGTPAYGIDVDMSKSLFEKMFIYQYQWMMIFALPFILMYNGERGEYNKKFFYIYYPAHIVLLNLLSQLIF